MTTEEGVDLDPMTSETGYGTDLDLANEKEIFTERKMDGEKFKTLLTKTYNYWSKLHDETPEMKEKRLDAIRQKRRIKKKSETEEQRRIRLAKERESRLKRGVSKIRGRLFVLKKRESETPEEKRIRLEKFYAKRRLKLQNETPEERRARLDKVPKRKKKSDIPVDNSNNCEICDKKSNLVKCKAFNVDDKNLKFLPRHLVEKSILLLCKKCTDYIQQKLERTLKRETLLKLVKVVDKKDLESPLAASSLDLEYLFPNPPIQILEEESPGLFDNENSKSPAESQKAKTSSSQSPITIKTNGDLENPKVASIRIPIAQLSPNSYYSSSSESCSSASVKSAKPRSRKRSCKVCNKYFRHRSDFFEHHKIHVTQPQVIVERLSEADVQYYLNKNKQSAIMPSVSPSDGLKLKFKLSGSQLCEVLPKEPNPGKKFEKKIRILTAQEIKQSTSPIHETDIPTTVNPVATNPLAAMEAIVKREPSQMMEENKMHFECPTLDGLDHLMEETSKDDAAAMLKNLLENADIQQDTDWNSTSEFISIDRLAHICTVCHSNFTDEMMLYEHKRISGHNFNANEIPPKPYLQHPAHPMMMRPPLQHQMGGMGQFGQQRNMPMEQLAQQVRSMPLHHPGYPQQYPGQPGGPIRRPTPPPLYRAQSPGSQNQLDNQRFMMMHQMHGGNPALYRSQMNSMCGGGMVMNNNGFPPRNNQMTPPGHPNRQPNQMTPPMQLPPRPQNQPQSNQQRMQMQQRPQPQIMMRPPSMLMARPQMPRQQTPNLVPIGQRIPDGIIRNGMHPQMKRPSPPVINAQIAKIRDTMIASPPLNKKIRLADDDDCEMISMQPRSSGIPIIASVQGASPAIPKIESISPIPSSSSLQSSSDKSQYQMNDQITLTSVKKDVTETTPITTKNPKDVANILANRGITVTPSANKANAATVEKGTSLTTDESVQKIQLNSSVSIISKKKTSPPSPNSIDLTEEKESDEKKVIDFLTCTVPGCKQKFLTQDALNKHTQKGHKIMTTNIGQKPVSCRNCPLKFNTLEMMQIHNKKAHLISPDELGIPIVDLRNETTKQKLLSLGINNYIPLANLNKETGGNFALPIVSVAGAANSAICNLAAIGGDSILSIGPIKTLPSRQSSQPPQQGNSTSTVKNPLS